MKLTPKIAKLWKIICIELFFLKAETKFAERKTITILWVIHVLKNFQIWTLIMQLLAKHRFLKKLAKILHINKYKYYWIFKTTCFFSLNFIAGTCREYSFSFLPFVNLQRVTHPLRESCADFSISLTNAFHHTLKKKRKKCNSLNEKLLYWRVGWNICHSFFILSKIHKNPVFVFLKSLKHHCYVKWTVAGICWY